MVVALAVLGLGLSLTINPVAVPILAATLAVIVGLGTEYVFHTIPGHRFAVSSVVLPALLTFIGTFFLRVWEGGVALVIALAGTGALLYAIIACEYAVLHRPGDPIPPPMGGLLLPSGAPSDSGVPDLFAGSTRLERLARNAIMFLIYAEAFALYLVVYQAKLRSLISATAVSLATVALSHRFLSLVEGRRERAGWYALVTGLCLGEVMWALNYWVLSGFAGGLFLLACLYFVSGVFRQHLLGKLGRRVALEYGGISLLLIAVIVISARFLG